MSLVNRRYDGVVTDLLAAVGGVHVGSVVVNTYSTVRVTRVDGDLNGGREDVWCGDVEVKDGGILEDESWFVGLKNCPNNEYDQEEDE